MTQNKHSHKVTINEKRRENKRTADMSGKPVFKKIEKNIFETYYRNQIRALYRAVLGE